MVIVLARRQVGQAGARRSRPGDAHRRPAFRPPHRSAGSSVRPRGCLPRRPLGHEGGVRGIGRGKAELLQQDSWWGRDPHDARADREVDRLSQTAFETEGVDPGCIRIRGERAGREGLDEEVGAGRPRPPRLRVWPARMTLSFVSAKPVPAARAAAPRRSAWRRGRRSASILARASKPRAFMDSLPFDEGVGQRRHRTPGHLGVNPQSAIIYSIAHARDHAPAFLVRKDLPSGEKDNGGKLRTHAAASHPRRSPSGSGSGSRSKWGREEQFFRPRYLAQFGCISWGA